MIYDEAPKIWQNYNNNQIQNFVLYKPISHPDVVKITINPVEENLINLEDYKNERLIPLQQIDDNHVIPYLEYSMIRERLFNKIIEMLSHLPKNIGVTYSECLRPLYKQKEYFINKFKEIQFSSEYNMSPLESYMETCKYVSPFINNVPVHCTGAAIDMTLFSINNDGTKELLDMGKFDVISGPNSQQETFSPNINQNQIQNRILLLEATSSVGIINYGYEWWHYSFGDKPWAYVNNEPFALYDIINDDSDDENITCVEEFISIYSV